MSKSNPASRGLGAGEDAVLTATRAATTTEEAASRSQCSNLSAHGTAFLVGIVMDSCAITAIMAIAVVIARRRRPECDVQTNGDNCC